VPTIAAAPVQPGERLRILMLKRLIEVALPLKEVSEQSAREKSIRHGHISTLHIWWARRPLAACRAVVFASLIPDPDDPECPESFRSLVNEVLQENEYKPKKGDGSTVEDIPRNRCLEYIKHLVRWENSNKPHYIEPARRLIAAAHKILHPSAKGDAPRVLDPFAGGGAIPLEALRLGCEAHAIDLNPVAHLIELCTLVYPQKYGQPNSRPVPDYIKLLNHKGHQEHKELFPDPDEPPSDLGGLGVLCGCKITEAEYRKNPLAADVKYWGHWVLEKARQEIGQFYPPDADGSVPVAYIWTRTVKSPSPQHPFFTPLFRHSWLCKKGRRKIAFHVVANPETGECRYCVEQDGSVTFDPSRGTVRLGKAVCSFSEAAVSNSHLQTEGKAGRLKQQLAAVVLTSPQGGRTYRAANSRDNQAVEAAASKLAELLNQKDTNRLSAIPDEKIPPTEIRRLSTPLYGLDTFGKLFIPRQLLALVKLCEIIRNAESHLNRHPDEEYSSAVMTYLSIVFDRILDRSSTACIWHTTRETIEGTVGRHTLPMNWDFAESNPITGGSGNIAGAVEWVVKMIESTAKSSTSTAVVTRGMAQQIPDVTKAVDAIITDPPYYDSVPYSHLADFFYVWLKRILGQRFPALFSTPLCPKGPEIVQDRPHKLSKSTKTKAYFEQEMAKAFTAANRKLAANGLFVVVYAHKTTAAWETLVSALLKSGFKVEASWPLHTEMTGGMVKTGKAILASSIFLVCRKRSATAGDGLWDDVRKELKPVAKERLDFFWSQGIRGADFFISAIGPALSVFGKYEQVKKLSGEEVSVGQFLDEVRGLVTAYALNKIMKTTHTATIDPDSQFYVIWKWSYGEAKVPADEAFKLAQALGMDTETMWDRTGILEKAGENVLAVPVAKRMKIKNLGEPNADTTPASLIDVLHRLCVFRDKNDTEGMTDFLGRSGQGRNPNLWLVAQAVSEILPDGDKEKQLMQGLLNQRDQLEEAGRQGKLF
jgi:putative DNA methylase